MTAPSKQQPVAVLLGGMSSEREISLESGGRMAAVLRERGYQVCEIDPGRDAAQQLRASGAQRVVVGLHGTYGEDGCTQGMLEIMGLAYTGSPPLASALALDKVLSKRVFQAANLRTPAYAVLQTRAEIEAYTGDELGFPQVVKPAAEGSSVGISIVRSAEDLSQAVLYAHGMGDGRVLCEAFIQGVEVSVGVLDGEALGTVQITPATEFYDYEAKYLRDDTRYACPAPLPQPVLDELHGMAARTHDTLGCAGATRVDFIVDEQHRPWLIELNTLPGMTDHSLLPMTARLQGLSFADLVERILAGASLWHRSHASTAADPKETR